MARGPTAGVTRGSMAGVTRGSMAGHDPSVSWPPKGGHPRLRSRPPFSERIRVIEGVTSTETFMYLRLRKQTYSWGVR